jgi:hypothetical protein
VREKNRRERGALADEDTREKIIIHRKKRVGVRFYLPPPTGEEEEKQMNSISILGWKRGIDA